MENASNPSTTTTGTDAFSEVLQEQDGTVMLPTNQVDEICRSNPVGNRLKLLESAYEARKAVEKAQLSHLMVKLEEDAPELRTEEIKLKTKEISDLLLLLDTAVSEKQLLDRLSAEYLGNFMKLRGEYHEAAVDSFSNIANCLNELRTNLDSIDWHDNNSFRDTKITRTCELLQNSTTHIENASNILSQLV